MLGTKKPAEDGTLTVLVSGADRLIERVQPALDAIGSRTVVAGDRLGAASALKLACNAWVATITAATAQSLALAETLGVDPRIFLDSIEGAPTGSPYAQVKGAAMLAENWSTSFAVDGVVKDVDLMRAAARRPASRRYCSTRCATCSPARPTPVTATTIWQLCAPYSEDGSS